MNNGKKKSTNGVKIFCGSTVILFLAVYLMSGLPKIKTVPENEDDLTDPAGTDVQTSETLPVSSEDEAVTMPNENYTGEDDPMQTEMTDESSEEEETLPEDDGEPKPLADDADNTWAMFLVNQKNQVSKEYSDGIETARVYENSYRSYEMDSRMSEFLKQMISAADEDGIQLIVMSAYRSYEYQQNNFDNSVQQRIDERGMTREEAEADTLKEVQLPGFSEHNAGIAADIMSVEEISMDDDRFKNTEAYAWLSEHAAEYGFILRYPEGKEDITGIVFEPWHYRFVGVYYANLIKDKGITLEEFFEEMNWVDENGKATCHLPELE